MSGVADFYNIRSNDHVVETILLCRLVGFYVSEEWQVNILTLNLI